MTGTEASELFGSGDFKLKKTKILADFMLKMIYDKFPIKGVYALYANILRTIYKITHSFVFN